MKKLVSLALWIAVALAACKQNTTQQFPDPQNPKALEDRSSSYDVVSKRGYSDLVQSLYNELAAKTPELKELETRMGSLREGRSDSLERFTIFHAKNENYFSAATNHFERIKDSTLKGRLRALVAVNLSRYRTLSGRHSAVLRSIELKEISLADLHEALMILRTLPLIEKYGKDNLPSAMSMAAFAAELDKTAAYADTLVNK